MGTVAVRTLRPATATRRYLMVIPLGLLCLLAIGLGYSLNTAKTAPSVQLGAPAEIPGGIAMITGIVPLEVDGWQPPSPVAALQQDAQVGTHRVRVEMQFTALDPAGTRLDPARFIVDGLGSGQPVPLWSSPDAAFVQEGESVRATMVFELPDKAVALVLEGPDGGRLSLGKEHHSGG
ncbi:hypothetical protein OIU93_15100 [Paeniglutamicibacter sp. ZC-3]|uniref:hypothetical protein n=1 Tax=Paeniglutamicibacter sp. ZC-3 TaxID=2986919 RepID=UPI0021F7FDFA|nr:hypothetical protein [Paeniglutamicibacter sp. ZC-3]MCV9995614.1 hypothetical protein [Paeniglutamicibacter sp. ZC-3]